MIELIMTRKLMKKFFQKVKVLITCSKTALIADILTTRHKVPSIGYTITAKINN